MGSIVVSGGIEHHFHNNMFGGGSAHQQPQESPAVHHTPVRPSPQATANPPPRIVAPSADVPMADSGAPPTVVTPSQRSQHHGAADLSAHAHASSANQSAQPPPPSPRFRPQSSQHATPAGAHATPSAFAHPRPVPSSSASSSAQQSPIASLRSPLDSTSASPRRIKVKSLSHIQSFATDESSPFSQTRSLSRRQRRDPSDVGPQYEISEMPVSDIIEMVAGLLTKITTTNDRQHEHLHRQIPPPEGASGLSQQTTSVLAFHGKNVPSISILSYLSRIHKYCPTTYEVFLSLLVYFDRMTERVNAGPMLSLRQANQQSLERANAAGDVASSNADPAPRATTQTASSLVQAATPPPSGSLGKPAETPVRGGQPPSPPQQDLESDPYNLSHFFVVDSFNIHRLVIAGVTCASKFFSDVFYTNSRYAKVGGLPLVELNHLELQFLLLNDFRLAVPLEEMEAYGTMLVEFYAREVAEQHDRQAGGRH
ncbi:cyclin-domain-containing protein [Corynespora cassiicola Philippines]|uniref:Cyclin-domain-containing protein n=1 Tax=Corynespora cassiicola Philippines TaxID=1448308 RepID=A0A2T2N5C2_CORCC|nr:cyclin-domain-containing protein [Corynespora cassiicola Philippines]